MLTTPPYQITTERCQLRCWEPADARALSEAITSSLENLTAWLPWAIKEPIPTQDRIAFLRLSRARFDRDEDYSFGVFSRDGASVIGGAGLHKRLGDSAFEIGYWVRTDCLRQGFGTEAAAALTRIGLTFCGATRVEIHCNPHNLASQSIPRKLGYQLDGVLRRRSQTPSGATRDTMIWSLFAEELSGTRSADSTYIAVDACGTQVW